jgi:hypothetical protein
MTKTPMQQIAAAIAAEFTDMVKTQNREGEEVQINRLAFAQRNTLNRLAVAMHYATDFQSEFVHREREGIATAIRESDGTEISLNNIERQATRLETGEMGLAVMEALKNALIEQHDAVSPNRKFQAPKPRAKDAPAPERDARLQALASKFGVTPEQLQGRNTDGTDGDRTESAAVNGKDRTHKAKTHAAG